MSESFEELDKLHSKQISFRVEIYKAWKSSGSTLDQDEWVSKHMPEVYDDYIEARRVAEIVNAEYDRQDRERKESMSDLEKLHEKLMVVAMEILDAWACSGSHLKQEKWVAKYMPEKLEIYHQANKVFREVMEERGKLQAEKDLKE
jgi:hypothetical protein